MRENEGGVASQDRGSRIEDVEVVVHNCDVSSDIEVHEGNGGMSDGGSSSR